MNAKHYKNYGGKGVKCRWESFREFFDDMYESFLSHVEEHGLRDTTLDRIDSEGDYSKENCRWATRKIQAFNTSQAHHIEFGGQVDTLQGLSKRVGINTTTLRRRIYERGMSVEMAVSMPVVMGRPKAS